MLMAWWPFENEGNLYEILLWSMEFLNNTMCDNQPFGKHNLQSF